MLRNETNQTERCAMDVVRVELGVERESAPLEGSAWRVKKYHMAVELVVNVLVVAVAVAAVGKNAHSERMWWEWR